ncbi:MAG: DNA/RNA nuclease SfsA [Lentisphaeria bacterium]|nr:DNA/RNA nuclease SfsA [Lentisphaeria bacterium]
MRYKNVVPGRFLVRRNRFIAEVELANGIETVHVKNTGRCRELLMPGARVYLEKAENPARKTPFDLIAVEKKRPGKEALLINMDSQVPNAAALEWLPASGLFSPRTVFRREVTFGSSRFDIFAEDGERRAFIEVKGVTLEDGGIALFPDAPTERGVKHLNELADCVRKGFEAYIFFVIQMKGVRRFGPNDALHPGFGNALRRAVRAGVKLLVRDCRVTPDSIEIDGPVEADLKFKT